VTKERRFMATPSMNEYFSRLAADHREKAAASEGSTRSMHREKAEQYDRLAGKRDLYRKAS
jgi:hypothetical protein